MQDIYKIVIQDIRVKHTRHTRKTYVKLCSKTYVPNTQDIPARHMKKCVTRHTYKTYMQDIWKIVPQDIHTREVYWFNWGVLWDWHMSCGMSCKCRMWAVSLVVSLVRMCLVAQGLLCARKLSCRYVLWCKYLLWCHHKRYHDVSQERGYVLQVSLVSFNFYRCGTHVDHTHHCETYIL